MESVMSLSDAIAAAPVYPRATSSVDEVNNTLAIVNAHPRDKNISFEPIAHKYTIVGADGIPAVDYTSVTTYNGQHFEHFDSDEVIKKMRKGRNWGPENKYYHMTDEQIKKQWTDGGAEASGLGEKMHFSFECFMNNPELAESKVYRGYTHHDLLRDYIVKANAGKIALTELNSCVEWKYFLNYINDNPTMVPYRTEWRIYHEELRLAGSIDMLYKVGDGSYVICDWKRSKDMVLTPKYKKYAITPCIKHLYDTNYWHYVLQLNTYKMILQTKYEMRISQMFLVRIHPNGTNYELYVVPDIGREINDLANMRLQELYGLKTKTEVPVPPAPVLPAGKPVSNDDLLRSLMFGAKK